MVRQVTPRQLELLLDFLQEHQSLALGKARGKEGNALSKRLWRQCADILNTDAGGLSKSGQEWKKYYNQYKSRTKAKLRQIKQGRTSTGGGPAPGPSLFPLEERLINIVGGWSSPLPVRQNPLDSPTSFEPATDSSGHDDGTDDIFIVQQDAGVPVVTPTASQIKTERLEVPCDAASCSGDRNPPKRRRRSSSSKANKEFGQSLIEVHRELALAMNRHSSAMEEIAGAAKHFVGLYEETLRLRRRRRRRASNSSNSSILGGDVEPP